MKLRTLIKLMNHIL